MSQRNAEVYFRRRTGDDPRIGPFWLTVEPTGSLGPENPYAPQFAYRVFIDPEITWPSDDAPISERDTIEWAEIGRADLERVIAHQLPRPYRLAYFMRLG